jgi:vitamin B12 transporter
VPFVRSALVAGCALAATVPPAIAQVTDTTRLGDLVVTAARLESSRSALPGAITVVTGEELARRGFRFVADWLKELPGATVVESGSFGTVTSLFLRGGESDYVKLLVDGVPVNQPGGSVNLAHLGTADVERIEVVRGPASVLYGSDAVTGVIQVFTRQGGQGTRLSLLARGGSLGSNDLRARVAGGTSAIGWSAGASRFGSSGTWPFNSDYRNWEADARISSRPGERTDLSVSARWGDAETHFPTDFTGQPVDSNQFTRDRALTLALDAGYRVSGRTDIRLTAGRFDSEAHYSDTPDSPADRAGYGFEATRRGDVQRTTVDLRGNLRVAPTVILTAGGEGWHERQQLFDSTASDFGAGAFTAVDRFEAERSNLALYGQALADIGAGVALQAGTRWDDNEVFGGFATWRLGAVYRPVATIRLHLLAGSAFKQPSFSEQFAKSAFEVGNPGLSPERSASWEMAGEADLLRGKVSVAATWFDQRFRDLIGYVAAQPGEPTYTNLGEATARGLELTARVRPAAGLELAAGLTELRTRVEDPGPAGGPYEAGDRLLRRPERTMQAGVTWRPRGALLATNLVYTGERDDVDYRAFPSERVALPAFTVVNASADVPLDALRDGWSSRVALTLEVRNLLDAHYESVVGFPGRGRVVMVGVRVE